MVGEVQTSTVAGEGIVWVDVLMRVGGGVGEGLVWVDLWVAEGGRGLTFGLRGEVTQPSS